MMDKAAGKLQFDSRIPIVCFSTTDWNEAFGSRQQLMLLLAKQGHLVLFIERQVGPEHLLRDGALRSRKLAAWKSSSLRQVKDNIWLWQPPLMPPGRYYSTLLNQLGQAILVRLVRETIETLQIHAPVLWLYPPHSSPLLGRFGEILSVYHCIEHFSGNQIGIKRQVMQEEENDLLKKADIVFTHSQGLRTRHRGKTKREITLIPSAADVDFLQETTAIDPLVNKIPQPRIGVVGTLDGRLDVPLLANIFSERPGWQLVLIGTLHPERANFNPLFNLPNVHFLGIQPFERLPALLNGLDIFLIPYVINEMTQFINPIKLYEYLAVGKPIVSTNLPEVSHLSSFVRMATGKEEFSSQIDAALASDSPNQRLVRRNEAHNHSWVNRLKVMCQVIENCMREKSNEAH